MTKLLRRPTVASGSTRSCRNMLTPSTRCQYYETFPASLMTRPKKVTDSIKVEVLLASKEDRDLTRKY